jgi:hypothetical protein
MILRQSTARTIPLGPFVDSTDGKTYESGLTIAQAAIRVFKNIAWTQTTTGGNAVHAENGWYSVVLSASDTNQLGILIVAVDVAGALQAWVECVVLSQEVYDTLFSTSLNVNVTAVNGTSQTAGDLVTLLNALAAQVNGLPAIVIQPVEADLTSGRLSPALQFNIFRQEAKSFILTVVDENGDPVDLTAGALVFVVETAVEEPVEVFNIADAVISGEFNNIVTIDITEVQSDISVAVKYQWKIWLDDLVLQHGRFVVLSSGGPPEDPPT